MGESKSSASYTGLYRYADVMTRVDGDLGDLAGPLRTALELFMLRCSEFQVGVDPALVAPLQRYVSHNLTSSAWVRNVGQGFERADGGGLAIQLAALKYAPPVEGYRIDRVGQTDLAVFFSQYEDDIPGDILDRYLRAPEMMEIQKAVLADLIDHLRNGGEPLDPRAFYEMVLQYTKDPGTALLICHNLLKALSRGSESIPWERISPTEENPTGPTIYRFDGEEIRLDELPVNPNAEPNWGGRPSIFYRLFDPQALGDKDPGDWYHYYLTATAAYYGATGRVDYGDYGAMPNTKNTVGREVNNIMGQFRDPDIADTDAYKGFRFANSLSFLEGAIYGADYSQDAAEAQAETSRESRLHLQGTLFGLDAAGQRPAADWRWNVPEAGSVTPSAWDAFWGDEQIDDASEVTHEQLIPESSPPSAGPPAGGAEIPGNPRRGENARRDR